MGVRVLMMWLEPSRAVFSERYASLMSSRGALLAKEWADFESAPAGRERRSLVRLQRRMSVPIAAGVFGKMIKCFLLPETLVVMEHATLSKSEVEEVVE